MNCAMRRRLHSWHSLHTWIFFFLMSDRTLQVNGVSIDRTLGMAASGSFDGKVKVWDIYTGELAHEFQHTEYAKHARVRSNRLIENELMNGNSAGSLWPLNLTRACVRVR